MRANTFELFIRYPFGGVEAMLGKRVLCGMNGPASDSGSANSTLRLGAVYGRRCIGQTATRNIAAERQCSELRFILSLGIFKSRHGVVVVVV